MSFLSDFNKILHRNAWFVKVVHIRYILNQRCLSFELCWLGRLTQYRPTNISFRWATDNFTAYIWIGYLSIMSFRADWSYFVVIVSSTKTFDPKHKKTYHLTCASNEESNQPAHPCSLIRVFVVRMKKLWILDYTKCAQWRFWSDCVDAFAQSDQNLHWAKMYQGTYFDITPVLVLADHYEHKTKKCASGYNNLYNVHHYENTPIQIVWKFYHQKMKTFR